jgi:dolichyl-phosphate-mannose-protein mannosyltransferase
MEHPPDLARPDAPSPRRDEAWAPGSPDAEPHVEPGAEPHAIETTGPEPSGAGAPVGEAFVYGTRAERFRRTPWYLTPLAMVLIVTALAGGLRFYHLSTPKGYVFDEVYYAKDGCYDAGIPYRRCQLDDPGEQTVTVHPPVGRELIALSIRAFGNHEFGWRFASAVAGTLSVLLLAILAWKLLDGVAWGYAAGILLATENLNLVQSRISMLDIFIALFVVAGFLFVLLDRRWIERRTPEPKPRSNTEVLLSLPPDPVPSPILRPWRLAAGVAFGLATATKWSGGTALFGAIVLTFAWERTRRKRAGYEHPLWEAFRDEAFGIFLLLVLVPVVVYAGSYVRWFLDHGGYGIESWKGWLQLQRQMADFSLGLRSPHPYASPPWKWILMIRPVSYYFTCPQKAGANTCVTAQAITGMGNPLVFWLSIPALVYAGYAWIRQRRWRAGLVVVAFACQYFPWFLAKRTSFLFYMTPITPFMVLALVYALRDLSKVRVGVQGRSLGWVAAGVVFLSVAMFAFFWPILTAMITSWGAWHIRMWMPSWV